MNTLRLFRPIAVVIAMIGSTALAADAPPRTFRIGSKVFTESVILGEIGRGLVADAGLKAIHRKELGGSQILFHALEADQLDAYPEYTGTIAAEILGLKGADARDEARIRAGLAARGIGMSRPLGFDNTYAIGMRAEPADRLAIATISDLARHPELRFGFGNEFMDRADGWPGLRAAYGLPQNSVRGLDHDLAYRALASDEIDATELYSTDAEIRKYGLKILRDDRGFFPSYRSVWLYRTDLAPAALAALARLEGKIDEPTMTAMNARAKLDGASEPRVAADFLASRFGIAADVASTGFARRLLNRLGEHLVLVITSLAAAIAAAIPLGVLAARRPKLGRWILAGAGVLQTIPSLALLVFLIPQLGIGAKPVLVALFLYSLLPIVRNTATGLRDVPASLVESAEALGLSSWARLRLVELPMASRSILGGIKTAAVINVGTATIGALIGAGGFGQPIFTGLRRDDTAMILYEGAIPAAVLALVVQAGFDLSERWLVPRGLREATPGA